MKFTLSWLKDHLETDASVDALLERLTALGLEVESVENKGAALRPFVVAQIEEAQPHPDADKLRVCQVRTTEGLRTVVCGAPNARAGIKVVLADIGVHIPRDGFTIKRSKIRGVESNGMLCSADELGLEGDAAGIIELPADAPLGASVVDVLGLDETVIEIAITPNRGDCLGVYGIARDLAASGLGTLKPLASEKVPASAALSLSITTTTEACRAFAGRKFTGLRNGESPAWLQERLRAVGLRPISALVDVTNYFTVAYGRPLHVYDAQKVRGGIVARESVAGESLLALNGKTYALPAGLCVIADEAGVLGLGGVMGGDASGCTEATSEVILECAWFEPTATATTGRTLSIDSDARYRFDRTVDAAFVLPATELATKMILELCATPQTQVGEVVLGGAVPDLTKQVSFDPKRVATLGGLILPEAQIEAYLMAVGCVVRKEAAVWQVVTPSFRPDIEGEADLVEEVLRLHGYDHLPEAALPAVDSKSLIHNSDEQRVRTVRRTLAAQGMMGVCHFAFVDRESAQRFAGGAELVEVINPISSELDTMRPSLVPAMLQALARNIDRGFKDVALFEVGAVFKGIGAAKQSGMVCGVRTGATPQHWLDKARSVDVFDVKADMLAVLAALGMDTEKLKVTQGAPAHYHPGRSGTIALGKNTLASFGMVHPAILRAYDLGQDVALFEIHLDNVPQKKGKAVREALSVSDHQASRRDFAFIVDVDVPAADLLAAIRNAERVLLKDVQLFDVYAGKGVPEGKRSLALSVTLQAADRTLTEDDLSKVSTAIIGAATKLGAVLRG